MAKLTINTGRTPNDKTGDSLKLAFTKVNNNFTELYTALGLNDTVLSLGAYEFNGSIMTTTDSTAIVIDQAATITSNLSVGGDILPQTANGGDLGSSTLPWRSLYVSNNTIYIGGVAIGLNANNNLTVNGSQVTGGSVSSLVNGASTVSLGADGSITFPDMTVQTTAYTGTSTTRSAGSVAGAGTVTLNYSTDRLVRATAAGSTLTIAHSNIAVGKVVDLVLSNTSGSTCIVTYGVAVGNTVNGSATTVVGAGTTRVFTCRSFGTTTTDVYVTIV
jgi:hypothetical protein